MLIEAGGAIFKGDSVFWPEFVWDVRKQEWCAFHGETPKEVVWGDPVTAEQAKEFMEPF